MPLFLDEPPHPTEWMREEWTCSGAIVALVLATGAMIALVTTNGIVHWTVLLALLTGTASSAYLAFVTDFGKRRIRRPELTVKRYMAAFSPQGSFATGFFIGTLVAVLIFVLTAPGG
jgi:hypothetical protein